MKLKIGATGTWVPVGPNTEISFQEGDVIMNIKADTVFTAMFRGLGIMRPGADKLTRRVVVQGATRTTIQSKGDK